MAGMFSRGWCVAMLLVLLLVPNGRVRAATTTAVRPNILFLFADDQRADTIGAWGNPHIRTPHLDRLVARGFSFRGNYCFGGNSGAVCIPSRAMLMSGRTLSPNAFALYSVSSSEAVSTEPRVFRHIERRVIWSIWAFRKVM